MREWRRKWFRTPIEQRRAAAASLHDLFTRPSRLEKWIGAALAVSLGLHLLTVPVLLMTGPDTGRVAEAGGAYLRKVLQKERAKKVSKEVQGRVTMPPPPENPEEIVENTFEQSLSGDVEKLIGNMLDEKVVKRLAKSVTVSLKDELARVSEDIVAGKMSEEEIRKLHEEFKKKAHDATMDELMKYREETQLERAEMSTTEWYEKEMSPTLLGNINHALLVRRTHYAGLWYHVFCGRYAGWTRYRNWSGLRANGYLGDKIGRLQRLRKGLVRRYAKEANAAWPGPGKKQAEVLEKSLAALYNGTVHLSHGSVTYPSPSWKAVIYGDIDRHNVGGTVHEVHLTDGILTEFWPHREEEMIPVAERLDGLWDRLFERVQAYRSEAEAGATTAKLTPLRDACFQTIDELCSEARKLRSEDGRLLQQINWCVRVGVLTGDMQDRMFQYWTDEMVDALAPLIRKIAKGQFEKGIIVHKAGVEEAMKEFTEKVIPMLRRDLMRMVSRRKFRRLVWVDSPTIYKTPGDEPTSVPDEKDIQKEKARLAVLLEEHPKLKPYARRRREINEQYFREAIENTRDAILTQVLTGGLLLKQMYVFVEGVDYADRVKEKLDARLAALQGRGQDLTSLTKDGLPDTRAPLVALFFGASKGHGASLEPVETSMQPGYYDPDLPEGALRASMPRIPRAPEKTSREGILPQQAKLEPTFSGDTPRFEAIPFLHKFPRLDGDLTDWGEIRPLVLRGGKDPILVYAAWSYQGFFFAYHVDLPKEEFYYPTQVKIRKNMSPYHRDRAAEWAFVGDHLRLLFDTLDARRKRRGEPHTQEFVVLPRGTDTLPAIPGMERRITSRRDAQTKEWRGVQSDVRNFLEQPKGGPDGTGPYRVTRVTESGYTVEAFLPRTLFDIPVLAPGWHIGFDCAVGVGYQGRGRGKKGYAQYWACRDNTRAGNRGGNRPDTWGDVLLLGTDPRFLVQNAEPSGRLARAIIPGHSYLLTVVDPDRNVNLSRKDTVLVSAEVNGPGRDVEILLLKETRENSGIFRGYVDTQPGVGRQVKGILELQPGHEVVFGYVDLANAKGIRNPMTYVRLPVVAPLGELAVAPESR
jgi:hypothetical protein